MKNQSIQAPIWLEMAGAALALPVLDRLAIMPEMHDLCDQDRVKQLEAELSSAQEALSRMKEESLRIRRASHPTLSDADIETAQESISNRLTKQIEQLKRERGELCYQVEAEEEFLINSMQRQLDRVQKEKVQLENVLEQEQESLVNKMRNLDASLDGGVQSSPVKSTVAQLGGLGAVSRCSSVLSCDPSRESDYQATISTLQSENFRLLSENIRLSQMLRRHGISTSPGTPATAIPLRRCDSGLSDQSASRSGSISELRNCSRAGFDSEQEDACLGDEICPNISPIRPKPKF